MRGEFNRIDFEAKGSYANNCLKAIDSELPHHIRNLYIHDFIGNISTTRAFRHPDHVSLQYMPRFPICGGWKTDWNQGYTTPTKYALSRDRNDEQVFQLEVDFMPSFDTFLAEEYIFEIILPSGAVPIEVSNTF